MLGKPKGGKTTQQCLSKIKILWLSTMRIPKLSQLSKEEDTKTTPTEIGISLGYLKLGKNKKKYKELLAKSINSITLFSIHHPQPIP
jgi:hypothetical protein